MFGRSARSPTASKKLNVSPESFETERLIHTPETGKRHQMTNSASGACAGCGRRNPCDITASMITTPAARAPSSLAIDPISASTVVFSSGMEPEHGSNQQQTWNRSPGPELFQGTWPGYK